MFRLFPSMYLDFFLLVKCFCTVVIFCFQIELTYYFKIMRICLFRSFIR